MIEYRDMKTSVREQSVLLRKNGWSYNVISERLGVAKSTLSHWLREVPYIPNAVVRGRIRNGPAKAWRRSHERKMEKIAEAKQTAAQEIGILTKRDLWMLGIGLYIGEGTKLYESIRIINSDPDVVRLAIQWLRKVCRLNKENISIAVHLYPDVNHEQALRHWSKVTGVAITQFYKTQVDLRKNKSKMRKRKLPYGTAHIYARSRGKPQFGVTLHRRIIGWIEKVYKDSAGIV